MTIVQRKVKTGDYETYFHEGGTEHKETVIFIHGSGPGANAKANWQFVLEEYAQDFHVIAPDLVGFGDTDHPEVYPENGVQWMSMRIKQILDLMDSLNVLKANLVGNSLGGVVSMYLNMQAPERFEKIVLMGAGVLLKEPTAELLKLSNFHLDPTKENLKNLLSWFVHDIDRMQPLVDQVVEERFEMFQRPEILRSYRENFTKSTLTEMLIPQTAFERMENEFLLIHGYYDRFVPLQSSLYALDHLPNVELRVFKKCGHWAMIEQREEFLHATKHFFKKDKVEVEV
ncbi:alpha/beta fold hydrolase [Rummeliibacillus sp. JY-2-4R]